MVEGSQILIRKTTGALEPFDPAKLRASLQRAGASEEDRDRVEVEVLRQLRSGMTTRRLYQIAFRALRRAPRATAARYSLQRAILELGPSGYPFEQFLGELLRHEGWQAKVSVRLQGRHVEHEVDLDARRDGRRMLAECKFRIDANGRVDVKTALYVYGRAQDLKGSDGGYSAFWLVTNGRFTSDALRFGEGMGLYMLGWSHPEGTSLRERIDRAGLHPVTCLTHLRKKEKQQLLSEGVVIVADLFERPAKLDPLGLSANRLRQVRAEVEGLCAERPAAPRGGR